MHRLFRQKSSLDDRVGVHRHLVGHRLSVILAVTRRTQRLGLVEVGGGSDLLLVSSDTLLGALGGTLGLLDGGPHLGFPLLAAFPFAIASSVFCFSVLSFSAPSES